MTDNAEFQVAEISGRGRGRVPGSVRQPFGRGGSFFPEEGGIRRVKIELVKSGPIAFSIAVPSVRKTGSSLKK